MIPESFHLEQAAMQHKNTCFAFDGRHVAAQAFTLKTGARELLFVAYR
jgi:hypothetical protein